MSAPNQKPKEKPRVLTRFQVIYKDLIDLYRRVGQDPDRFPALRKEAHLSAFVLETTIVESSKATVTLLEPRLAALEEAMAKAQDSGRDLPADASLLRRLISWARRNGAVVGVIAGISILTAGLLSARISQAEARTALMIGTIQANNELPRTLRVRTRPDKQREVWDPAQNAWIIVELLVERHPDVPPTN